MKRDKENKDDKSRSKRDLLEEALSLSRRAVEIFTRRRHPDLQYAQETLAEIEEALKSKVICWLSRASAFLARIETNR